MDAKISRGTSPSLLAWGRHAIYLRAARLFLDANAAAHIRILPVKGIVTAHTLYDDPIERVSQQNDIDFLTRAADLSKVRQLADAHRWTIVDSSRAYGTLTIRVAGVEVDIGTTVGPPHISSLRVDAMIARADRSEALAPNGLFPSFDDHVVLLVLNVFKDKLTLAMPWAIHDLERLPRHPQFDATRVATSLRAARVATIGWIVADWLVTERGCGAWRSVRDELARFARAGYVWLRRIFDGAPTALPTRVLTRCAGDSLAGIAPSLATILWWQTERWRTRATKQRYGNVC